MSGFLRYIPKDVVNIIYRYTFSNDVLLHMINRVKQYPEIEKISALPSLSCIAGVDDKYRTLMSSRCKVSTIRNIILLWLRKSHRFSNCICQTMILCQDLSGPWNINFSGEHVFSIINGIVYHSRYELTKVKLVPFFRSNHCWQDLAVVFLRNRDKVD